MSLSELCTTFLSTTKLKDETERNIIEFAEAPWGLGMGSVPDVPPLFPVQKFIFKCYYNIPLDDSNKTIIVKDHFNEKERFRFTEIEYLNFLRDEGHINIKEVTGNPEDNRPNMTLVIGRRGCKSSSVAVLVAFETYKLLKKVCPQQYYRIMPDQEIRITCIATNQEQAGESFRMITGHLERAEYFRKYRNKPTLYYMQLNTQRDIDVYGIGQRPSIRVVAAPCSGRGLRGRNNIIAILDEMAYFFEEDTSPDRSDTTIYESVTPSVAKFNSPDGDPHGRIICISSTGARSGKFFELYRRSFESDCTDMLMVQAPTWEVDYTLSPKFLRAKYAENPISYDAEYGAQFSDKITAWIENEQVLRMNVVPGLKLKKISYERIPHFIGIDVGLKKDGTAIAICHVVSREYNGIVKQFIELDDVDVRYAEDEDKEFFHPDEMARWIASFTEKFYIVKGVMDQYYGLSILPVLHGKGIKYIEPVQPTREYNSAVYQNLMAKMLDASLRIPEGDEQIVNGRKTKDIPLIKELLSLQAVMHSKYLITVKAPQIEKMHDDMSDAFARSVHLASQWISGGGSAPKNITVTTKSGPDMTYRRYFQKQKYSAVYTNRPSRAVQTAMYQSKVSRSPLGQMKWR